MTLALAFLQRYWLPLVLLVGLGGGAWYAHHSGVVSGRAEVQQEWDAQVARDRVAADLAARARREQLSQVQLNAEQTQAKLRADAASANDAASRLRRQVGDLLAGRVAAGGAPGTDACGMLAQLLNKSVERARRLAEIADTARQRGLSCEAASGHQQAKENARGD